MISGTRGLAIVACGVLVGLTSALAYDWPTQMDLSQGQRATVTYATNDVATMLQVDRGAYVAPTGTFRVRATLTLNKVDVLDSCTLDWATDANASGVIEVNEWVNAATATIVESGGVTTATIAPTTLSASRDAYRIRQNRTDFLPMDDVIRGPGISLP